MIVIQNVAFLKAEVCNETKLLNVLLISSVFWLFSAKTSLRGRHVLQGKSNLFVE